VIAVTEDTAKTIYRSSLVKERALTVKRELREACFQPSGGLFRGDSDSNERESHLNVPSQEIMHTEAEPAAEALLNNIGDAVSRRDCGDGLMQRFRYVLHGLVPHAVFMLHNLA
jgi:hypothetical protein